LYSVTIRFVLSRLTTNSLYRDECHRYLITTSSVIKLSMVYLYAVAECWYAACRYAECRYADCRRVQKSVIKKVPIVTSLIILSI